MPVKRRPRPPVARITLSVAETAEALGISVRYAKTLIQRGEIPAVRVGTRMLVPVDQLKARFAEQLGDAAAAAG